MELRQRPQGVIFIKNDIEKKEEDLFMKTDRQFDAKGLRCPLPILKLSKFFKEMTRGEIMEITADDKAFEPDVKAWCKKTGNAIIEIKKEGGNTVAFIRKG